MTERSVLFSAPMIKAVLDERKTQTRRFAKPKRKGSILERKEDGSQVWDDEYIQDPGNRDWLLDDAAMRPGDPVWVRENFRLDVAYAGLKPSDVDAAAAVFFEAGGQAGQGVPGKLWPSIHMPRKFSRIDLRCTDARVERLHEITEADAIAEGITVEHVIVGADCAGGSHREITADRAFWDGGDDEGYATAVEAYEALWVHLHGRPSWEANPLVWIYSFEKVRP